MILLLLGLGVVSGAVAAGAMLWSGAGILTILAAYSLGGMVGMGAGATLLLKRADLARDPAADPQTPDRAERFARETSHGPQTA